MKRLIVIIASLSLFLISSTTTVFAGKAGVGSGVGNSDGGACVVDITTGTPVTISGIVVGVSTSTGGIQIDTDISVETVIGIGPMKYWKENNMLKPQLGDTVIVDAVTVGLSGALVNVAISIIVNEMSLDLRDPDTGVPLWY